MVFVLELGFACVPGVTAPFLLVLIVSETTDSAFFRYLSSLYSSERLCCCTVTFVVLLLHLPSLFPICLFAFVLPDSCRASYHMTKRIPFSMHYASFFERREHFVFAPCLSLPRLLRGLPAPPRPLARRRCCSSAARPGPLRPSASVAALSSIHRRRVSSFPVHRILLSTRNSASCCTVRALFFHHSSSR